MLGWKNWCRPVLEDPFVSIMWRIWSMVASLGSCGTSHLKLLLNFARHALCWCPALLLSPFCAQSPCCVSLIARAGLQWVCSLCNDGDVDTVQLWNSCVLMTGLSIVSWWNLCVSWAYFLHPNLAGTPACASSAWEENCALCTAFWSSIHTFHKLACAEMIIRMFTLYLKHF